MRNVVVLVVFILAEACVKPVEPPADPAELCNAINESIAFAGRKSNESEANAVAASGWRDVRAVVKRDVVVSDNPLGGPQVPAGLVVDDALEKKARTEIGELPRVYRENGKTVFVCGGFDFGCHVPRLVEKDGVIAMLSTRPKHVTVLDDQEKCGCRPDDGPHFGGPPPTPTLVVYRVDRLVTDVAVVEYEAFSGGRPPATACPPMPAYP